MPSILCTIGLHVCFGADNHAIFVTISLKYNLRSGNVMSPASLFLLRIALAILGLLFFQMNFMIAFSSSMKNVIRVLV